jgi:hypothetical protein
LRHFFTRGVPPFDRVLVVESGSRELLESLLPGLYKLYPNMKMDRVTCYAGVPSGFHGDVFRVTDYTGREGRKRLYTEIARRKYSIIGLICSAEPIMTKWKWVLAGRVPAKLFILNENGDYFWVQWNEWKTIRHFILFRAGLSGAGAVTTVARLVAFPFMLLYLITYALAAHTRRRLRLMMREDLR